MAAVRASRGVWSGRIAASLSLGLLGFSLFALVRDHGSPCTARPGAGGSIDVAPLAFFAVAALVLRWDVRVVRRGGAAARWGRIGLTAISAAAVFGIWVAAESFLRAGCP